MRKRLAAFLERAADPAGRAVRLTPGVLGAVLVTVAAGLVYLPLAFLVAGVFLLLVDRRIP